MPRTEAQKASRLKYQSKASTKKLEASHHRAYYQRNRDAILLRTKLRKYGLSLEEYQALVERAAGHCETCGVPFDDTKPNKPHLDHCHTSEKVRGLLCAACNWAIGNVRDNTETLMSLINYLEVHRAEC